jgi:isopropylmalate/homocitrate/citramalate synthase
MEKDSYETVHADNLEMVRQALEAAQPHGLEAEVMWSALTFAAEANEHNESLADVLEAALGEWDI